MVFASIPFLLLFLPGVLLAYFAIAAAGALAVSAHRRIVLLNLCLLAASLAFYAWGERRLIVVMLITATTDFIAGLVISGALRRAPSPLPKGSPRTPLQKTALVIALTVNLGLLAFFKYANFGLATVHALTGALGLGASHGAWALDITLPLGISFYTFQSMSYTIDVYRGEVAATRSFLDFACLVTMFPHLIAGPIIRYRDIGAQLRDRTVSVPLFASGVARFIVGLGKKTLIANTIAVPVDHIFSLPVGQLTSAAAWFGAAGYALQIYFDFSGYSDMAIGLGRMFGFRFLENFNYPYAAASLTDFWRRWHISLSSWFRDYVYLPLGGNRGSAARTYGNLLIVFFLCGLWHGAQWAFICWGLYHGAFLIAERAGFGGVLLRVPKPARHAYTLLAVLGGWVLFRSASLAGAGGLVRAMLGGGAAGGLSTVAIYITPTVVAAFLIGAITAVPVVPWLDVQVTRWSDETVTGWTIVAEGARGVVRVGALASVLFASMMSLAGGTYNPFIYFRF